MEEEINQKLFISDSLESEIFYYIVCETDRSIVAVTDSRGQNCDEVKDTKGPKHLRSSVFF